MQVMDLEDSMVRRLVVEFMTVVGKLTAWKGSLKLCVHEEVHEYIDEVCKVLVRIGGGDKESSAEILISFLIYKLLDMNLFQGT